MSTQILTPPELDDETAVKLNTFLYDLLDAFEAHYCSQLLRYHRNLRAGRIHADLSSAFEDDEELPF